jgi:glycosyltransferase involved in cell wall biosynthesis
MSGRLRVGICSDFAEERWASMDRVATELMAGLGGKPDVLEAQLLRPPFRRRAMQLSSGWFAYSVDRAWNRFVDYPRHLGRVAGGHGVYHVVDHSYAHLALALPAGHTVVTCHDLDAFRPIFVPAEDRRSPLFRVLTQRILNGLRRAAVVACDTAAVGDELIRRGIVERGRMRVVPLGVAGDFSSREEPAADRQLAQLLPVTKDAPVVLHVGTTAPRKRIDLLLRFFARIEAIHPAPHLVRIGEAFTAAQMNAIHQLGIANRVTLLPSLDDRVLAAAYRRAAVVVLPSDREGFGLPVLEALRCGTRVVATDLPVLREVGGNSVRYCPAGDVDAWARAVTDEIHTGVRADVREAGVGWAEAFTWQRYADAMLQIYLSIARSQAGTLCAQPTA